MPRKARISTRVLEKLIVTIAHDKRVCSATLMPEGEDSSGRRVREVMVRSQLSNLFPKATGLVSHLCCAAWLQCFDLRTTNKHLRRLIIALGGLQASHSLASM